MDADILDFKTLRFGKPCSLVGWKYDSCHELMSDIDGC